MKNDVLLIEDTINGLCEHYSANENINGILKVVTTDKQGVTRIKIVLIYTEPVFESRYFGFDNYSDKCHICDNVILIIDSRESIDFGLLSQFKFMGGEPSPFSFLEKGEILYDKTGKYKELQTLAKRDGNLRKARTPRQQNSVPRVS